jgi:Mn2+/Fe2+ NRAMP family transporter
MSAPEASPQKKPGLLLAMIGPGLLVAATGVGAGDLATGAFTGAKLGVAVLWAVLLGALIKFVLNEGLARWQLATGTTVLEGTAKHFGRVTLCIFLGYLCVWSFFVGSALMSACGVAAHGLVAVLNPNADAEHNKVIFGIVHSAIALALVLIGGYRLFEKLMSVCIAVMFVIVVTTSIAVGPDWLAVAQGLVIPTIPQFDAGGVKWTVALMGGIGGTVTVLCYGYWIREEGRSGLDELKTCRIDLGTGYVMTALFGIGMVILGSQLDVDFSKKGATLVVELGNQLETSLGAAGPIARYAFLLGAWGAVFSSMLGVWQSVPYLFADCWSLIRETPQTDIERPRVSSESVMYRYSLYAIATVPAAGLFASFENVQLAYAVVGAAFMPILAVALIMLNGSSKRVGKEGRNTTLTTVFLIAIVVLFAWAGWSQMSEKIQKAREQATGTCDVWSLNRT